MKYMVFIDFVKKNILTTIYLVVIISVSLFYAFGKESVLHDILKDRIVEIMLMFIGSTVLSFYISSYDNYKKESVIFNIDKNINYLLSNKEKKMSNYSHLLGNVAARKMANHYYSSYESLVTSKRLNTKEIYENHMIISMLMEKMTEGDEFYGLTSIFSEWDDSLKYYTELNHRKARIGVSINRYFLIKRNHTKEQLVFLVNILDRQLEINSIKLYYLFEDEVVNNSKIICDSGSLLKYTEYGLFVFSKESPVLCYRRGVDIHDFEMITTADTDEIISKNIFEKMLNEHLYVYEDKVGFEKILKMKGLV